MRWDLFILIISGTVAILFFAALLSYESQIVPSESKISDRELIDRTRDLEEVKAILKIYDSPYIHVNRSEAFFGVEYHISSTQFEGKPYDPEHDCLHKKIRFGYDGYPDYTLDANDRTRYPLGDRNILEGLEDQAGGCLAPLVKSVPDSVVHEKTNEFEEVKAFIAKYPSASISLTKEYSFVVSYRITRSEVTGELWNNPQVPEPSAGLQVEMDKDFDVILMYLSCNFENGSDSVNSFQIYENIAKYLKNEKDCWNDDVRKAATGG